MHIQTAFSVSWDLLSLIATTEGNGAFSEKIFVE
jgi:hypothetical protein